MASIEQVSKQLTSDSSWFVKCFIGGLLMIVPIIWFLPMGYLYRLFNDGKREANFALPEWNDIKGLFIDGIRFFIVFIIFAGLPIGLMLLLSQGLPWEGFMRGLPMIPAYFIAGPLSCAALYLLFLRDDYRDCINFSALSALLTKGFSDYLVPTLAYVGLMYLGWVVLPFAFFVGGVVYFYLMGRIFKKLEISSVN